MNTINEHIWFTETMATYLADGLSGDERARFESHAAACAACAAELERARADEQRLTTLFDDATPAAGFEDRIIKNLRTHRTRRLVLHPWVAKAVATAAAVVIVSGVGYVAMTQVQNDSKRVRNASNLRQLGQTVLPYSNDQKDISTQPAMAGDEVSSALYLLLRTQDMTSEVFRAPSSNAEKWDFGGGSATDQNWSNWNRSAGAQRNLSYAYANPYPEDEAKRVIDGLVGGMAAQNGPSQSAAAPQLSAGMNKDEVDRSAVSADKSVQLKSNLSVEGRTVNGGYLAPAGSAGANAVAADSFKPTEFGLGGAVTQTGKDVAKGKEVAGAVVEQPGQRVEEQREKAQAALQDQKPPPVQEPPLTTAPATQRKVIRNGQIEFEVDSFDSALASIMKIASEETGFIATTNSEKLDNGKVKGTIVVRVPPDHLDTLVLKLRALGDLKRQNLTAQDVTKQYTDLESELRAARAMEERLIEIIKTGKGEIKDLLAAEKELANWRGKIEKIVGEINYYNAQVALSTLAIDLIERNISTAAAASEQEDVNMGVETEDVEASRAQAITAIDEAKGRIVEAEMKKLDAGQLAAKIVAEVPYDSAGPVIDRLKQLGKVARMDVQRKQTTPSGTAPLPGARVERKDTRLVVSLYNLSNVAPRQTSNLNLACDDVEAAYRAILARVEKAGGRVVSSGLNREKANQVTGSISFETKSAEAGPVLLDVRGLGEVMRLAVTENPDTANVTTAKHGFVVQLFAVAQIPPRETVTVQLAARDVPQAYAALVESAKKEGRVLSSQVSEQDKTNVSGMIDLELPRDHQSTFEQVLGSSGDVLSRNATRSPDAENTIDSKLRVQVSLIGADRAAPRETTTLGVETRNVAASVAKITSLTTSNGGRVIDSTLARESDGRSAARVIVELPLGKSGQVIDQIKQLGEVRTERATKNAQVPEGSLSRARVEVTLASPQAIVAEGHSVWSSIRSGLGTSFAGLMWSLQILVVGLCFVVPWALVLWGGWKLLKRSRRVTA